MTQESVQSRTHENHRCEPTDSAEVHRPAILGHRRLAYEEGSGESEA